MRFLIRLLGALWLTTLIVSVGFAWYEVSQDRRRLEDDLQRRATLTGDAVREASERLMARGARTGYDRVLARFSRPDRAIAIYDGFGSVIDATPDVRRGLGPISPLVGEAITKNVPARAFVPVAGPVRPATEHRCQCSIQIALMGCPVARPGNGLLPSSRSGP